MTGTVLFINLVFSEVRILRSERFRLHGRVCLYLLVRNHFAMTTGASAGTAVWRNSKVL